MGMSKARQFKILRVLFILILLSQHASAVEVRYCGFLLRELGKKSNDTFEKVLAEHIPDPKKRILLSRGAEGDVYVSQKNPRHALKFWRMQDQVQFETSIIGLMVLRRTVNNRDNVDLARVLQVTEVLSHGKNWIIRDFFPNSRPLVEVMKTDRKAFAKWEKAMELLAERRSKEIFKPIYERLKKKSPNFHYDPDSDRIIVIDFQ